MRERPISASSLKTFLQCKLKYWFSYEEKKPRVGKSDPLAFGSAVHEALELLHTLVLESGKPPTQEDYDKVIAEFMRSAVSYGLEDQSLYEEGRLMLLNRLDRADPEDKILGLELKFELMTPKGTPFLGSIDKLIELDKDTVAVIDYKTSRMALTQQEADTDVQLSMYDLAVSMMYPQYKTIVGAFDYLRLGQVVSHRTKEQRAIFVDLLDTAYVEILETTREDATPALNQFCGWCDFKNHCPNYTALIEDPELMLPVISELTDDQFVDAFESFKLAKRVINSKDREFKAESYNRLKHNDSIRGNSHKIYKTQSARKSFDSIPVHNIVGTEEFIRMSSVSTNSVSKYLKNNPDKEAEFDKVANFNFTAPTFRSKKID
jgi:RecB family exonuclease